MARRQKPGEVTVFLGGDSNIEGQLNFSGQARLDGAFKGEIRGTGALLIGPAARVEADIQAASVTISGEVIGEINASERIELRAPGKLKGNINAPLVVMDEGVLFEGHCSMAGEEAKDRAPKITLLASSDH